MCDRMQRILIRICRWAGRVYLFSQLVAKMVGEPAPTIIAGYRRKIMSIEIFCRRALSLIQLLQFQVQFLDLLVQNSLYYRYLPQQFQKILKQARSSHPIHCTQQTTIGYYPS